MSSPPPFHCEIESGQGEARVRPVGELDLATVGEVDARLQDAQQSGCVRLVLDLRGVTFMDSSGLRLILTWNDRAARAGVAFTLIPGDEIVQRVFDATRVGDLLSFEEPPPEA